MKNSKKATRFLVLLLAASSITFLTSWRWQDRRDAHKGDSQAQYRMGHHCVEEKEYKLAFDWFLKAAEQGHVEAQCWVGNFYYEGRGVARDIKKAAYWYQKAAEQGYADARCNLGIIYQYQSRYEEAAKWYRLAAKQGHKEAQYRLAELIRSQPEQFPRNQAEAQHWYKEAAKQGHKQAQERLAK